MFHNLCLPLPLAIICLFSNMLVQHYLRLLSIGGSPEFLFLPLPPIHLPFQSIFRDPSHESYFDRGFNSSFSGCDRGGSPSAEWKGILFKVLSHPQEDRGISSYWTSVIPSLDQKDWCASLDFQDAYFHIGIHLVHKHSLRFVLGNNLYLYWVFPLGSMQWSALIRRMGIQVFLNLTGYELFGTSGPNQH